MQNKIVNTEKNKEYIVGVVQLQALKKIFNKNFITEEQYKILKEKITKEYHILM